MAWIQILHTFQFLTHLAQSTPASPSVSNSPSTVEIELIREQIQFLKDANDNLASSFDSLTSSFESFTNAINIFFAIALGVLAIISGIAAFLGYRTIGDTVKTEVNKTVSRRLDSELIPVTDKINHLENVLSRESLLDKVSIVYISPDSDLNPPSDFWMLKQRIKTIKFKSRIDGELLKSDLVILDLDHSGISVDRGKDIAVDLDKKLERWAVLMIYTADNRSPVVGHLNNCKKEGDMRIEYVAANTKITLMERAIAAAYVADALKFS